MMRHTQFLRILYRKMKSKARQFLRNAYLNSWHELLSIFNHMTLVWKGCVTLWKFFHKTRMIRPRQVIVHNNYYIEELSEVGNRFGILFI